MLSCSRKPHQMPVGARLLDFPTSGSIRNKFIFLINYPVCDIQLLQQKMAQDSGLWSQSQPGLSLFGHFLAPPDASFPLRMTISSHRVDLRITGDNTCRAPQRSQTLGRRLRGEWFLPAFWLALCPFTTLALPTEFKSGCCSCRF